MRYIPTATLFSVVLILPHTLNAAPVCTQWVAKIMSLQGNVQTQAGQDQSWHAAHTGDQICPGDTLRILKLSRATLRLRNEAVLTLDQNTTLSLAEPEQTTAAWLLNLIEGAVFFRSRQSQHLNVHTPFINAVHEGTEFSVLVDKQHTKIAVLDGEVKAVNKVGQIQIKKGFEGIAEANKPPRIQPLTVKPQDAVQWTLYYPPLLDYQGTDSNPMLRQATLLLSVGRVDEAQTLIQQLLHSDTNQSDALALQAIIAVTQNQQQAALDFAQQAVKLDPESATAQIALSYAQQSLFNIDAALLATEKATQLAPENALAWARLSELQLASGEQDDAVESAETAQKLNPKLARTQIVLGFADLAQTDISDGQQAFEQAITLDSSDPLARLGLGLAKIRAGDIEEGKQELETAVNLDPNNAVIRSYLGKAYYELRNKDYAGKEFEIAKEMDAKDPTPWFYDAILKQTTNRPVEALQDMQKAVELNDNRGVYRSRLLLDKDLAARSAAQGRIYNDLGFQRLGLLEGWKSVNIDPTNFSAHRLLADSYASQPRHEIARVSELLQSQLLQPINITPIQPQLAQSNILIVDGLGSSSLSFNEYNPLFARNRFALQASGIYGGNNTWGEDIVHSGLWDKGSYSLGQFHYETDGFRKNNALNQDIYNAFVQGDITDSLNLQAEYRHEERKNGDLSVNFEPTDFSLSFKENRNIDTYRIGGRYIFSPKSSLIGSMIYQDVDVFQDQINQQTFFNPSTNRNQVITIRNGAQIKRKGLISELQHQYMGDQYSLVSGFGHIDQTVDNISFGFTPDAPNSISNPNITRTNLYSYLKFNSLEKIETTFGVSYDELEIIKLLKRHPVNPKFGIVWNPSLSTTFRAAVFRSMNITRTSNQTIEPTQVAGFNQLYDDFNGTIAWKYGVAADQ
ncbi:MAG: tetratricopeptide repeat protein, partial [Methylococcaceae bacterium]|nr:tetratricopeptide repeat protein [Methylococcaceae bacterium]